MSDIDNMLINAACEGDVPKATRLVSKGADVTAYNNSAVMLASHYKCTDMVEYLVSQGADVKMCPNHTVKNINDKECLDVVECFPINISEKI